MSRMILSADWHIRSDRPRCRLDNDWELTQREMVAFIVTTANKNNADLFIMGDVFHTPVVPTKYVIMIIEELSKIKNHVYFIAGNHDLRYHAVENMSVSSIGILNSIKEHHNKISVGLGNYGAYADFGAEIIGDKSSKKLFIHTLVFPNKKSMPPNCDAITASDLLKKYPWAKWIFTGDMHKGFHYEKEGHHVINPGCILRQAADLLDYRPMVFFADTEKSEIETIYLPDDGEMITDTYLRAEEERDDRITAFVESIKREGQVSLSIVDNINKAVKKNKKVLSTPIINMIESLVEEAQT